MFDLLLECLIIGDSIANGISQANRQCSAIVKDGITSGGWLKANINHPSYKNNKFKIAVISLGTNDFKSEKTVENLYDIRSGIKADKVFWILPSHSLKPIQRQLVRELSNEFHDTSIDISKQVGYDGIHPSTLTKYKEIGDKIFK
jgi:hypothetical protein